MDKLRLRFTKTDRAVYISHLDLMRTWQRAFFRAGIPLKYSEGFNPHAKLSIVVPLSVGTSSITEFLDFSLNEEMDLSIIPEKLNKVLPEGIVAIEAYEANVKGSLLKWIEFEGVFDNCENAVYLTNFYSRNTIVTVRKTKKGEKSEDIAPYIKKAEFEDTKNNKVMVHVILSAQEPTISPELFISALGEKVPGYYRFKRVNAYMDDMTVFR